MMPYIIILKVRKFHQTTASRFSTARKKPVGGAHCAPPSLNRVKIKFGVGGNFRLLISNLNSKTQYQFES